jgi:hypothetical protein
MEGLISGKHPFGETCFKFWAVFEEGLNRCCAGGNDSSRRRRKGSLSFCTKALLPDRLMGFF